MDNIIALVLTLLLVLRALPYILPYLSPALARRVRVRIGRFQALIDIAAGTLMFGLVVILLIREAWLLATILALIGIPTFKALGAGFRYLARNQ